MPVEPMQHRRHVLSRFHQTALSTVNRRHRFAQIVRVGARQVAADDVELALYQMEPPHDAHRNPIAHELTITLDRYMVPSRVST